MLLAIDTATRWTAIALFDGTAILAEWGWRCQNRQTVELAPAVTSLFHHAGTTMSDLSGIGVAIGPGSYTGLRIGLSFAKGIALAQGTTLVSIPTLDICAAAIPQKRAPLVVVAEAGRTRVIAGTYLWKGRQGWRLQNPPVISTWDELLDTIETGSVVTGEIKATAATAIRTAGKKLKLVDPSSRTRRAGFLAQLAWRRLRKGELLDPVAATPDYLRQPAGS